MKRSPNVRPLHIGSVTLDNNLVLAPMAGYTDVAFRRLCKDCGAGLTVTEMVSVNGLVHNNDKTRQMLRRADNETPSAVQLFGENPENFFRALRETEELNAFEIIDINMGCPVQKVVKQGEGSALMSDEARAAEIVRACVEGGGNRPVTVKMRLGRGERDFTAERFAAAMESAGACAVTVHGRTAHQMYRGVADWDKIALVKKAVRIPVIGNGDVCDATAFDMRMQSSGVDGVMIGRGALGHPQIFAEIAGGETQTTRAAVARHVDYMTAYFGEPYAVVNLRKHLSFYLKGIPGMKQARLEANRVTTVRELRAVLRDGFEKL